MEYVYKYLNHRGDTVYVGITNDMHRRVKEHRSDKLSEIKNPLIYYFPVKYRGDAEMLETYLIGWYGTKKYYNVSKTRKGDFSFLDVVEDFPWQRYEKGTITDDKPFAISDVVGTKEVVVEKEVVKYKKIYVDRNSYMSEQLELKNQERKMVYDFLDNQIKTGKEKIEHLKSMLNQRNSELYRLRIAIDLFLFDKRVRALILQRKYVDYELFPDWCFSKEEYGQKLKKYHRAKKIADIMLERLSSTGRVGKCVIGEEGDSCLGESDVDGGRSIFL